MSSPRSYGSSYVAPVAVGIRVILLGVEADGKLISKMARYTTGNVDSSRMDLCEHAPVSTRQHVALT